MNNKLKKTLYISVVTLGVLYVIFLALPLVLTPILRNYQSQITETVKTATGFDTVIEKPSITTTWNLRAGVKAEKVTLSIPTQKEPFFSSKVIGGNVSLLPLLFKKIQLGNLYAKEINTNIGIKKDGSLLALDYLPKATEPSEPFVLPFGLKLSNKLPDVKISKYNLTLTDLPTNKTYYTQGENLKISKFILDKRIKFRTKGEIVLDGSRVSNYDINIDNRIMPDLQLQKLVFPEDVVVVEENEVSKQNPNVINFNAIDFLDAIVKNKLCGDLTADIKTSGTLKSPKLNGSLNIDTLSVGVDGKKLPESYINLDFKNSKTAIDSILFSSFDDKEKTQIIGSVTTGKRPAIDMTLRSNAKFNNIIKLVNSISKSFSINDFETLSATGGIDADFNINSDLKKVYSNGYLKIVPSKISYGLYNVVIDNITADINFDNGITINKSGFSILSHPLSLTGTIEQNSSTDLTLKADKMSVKGLLTALGQVNLLKDNDITDGVLSVKALIKGKLKNLTPEIVSSVDNLKIYNKPSALMLALKELQMNANYDGKVLAGNVNIFDLLAQTGGSTIKLPDTNILLDTKDINIKKAYVLLNNSRIDITGGIKDYVSDKMAINLCAKGHLQSSDIVSLLPKEFVSLITYKGRLPLNINITGNSKIQNISLNLDADKNNYISLIDIDKLRNKTAKIKSNIEIIGDSLRLSNTGLYEGNNLIAEVTGGINKLYTNPKLNMEVVIPNQISFPIWGVPSSNISVLGSVHAGGKLDNPTLKGKVMMSDISMKDMDFAISDLTADLSGEILNGTATAKEIKMGGLAAKNLGAKFALRDYSLFSLTDITGKAFDGDIKGKLSYDINTSKTGIDFSGEGLNASNAIYGATGIKDALTGALNFKALLGMQGITDTDIIKSLNGNINFDIQNGRFVSIGRLENLVSAQNISSNSILKSAISALSVASTVQEADKFKSINGDLKLANGSADLTKILVAGPLMSYYVTGKYNILPNTANLIILGRLDSKVVSVLGVIGDLSAERLLSAIPKLGKMTTSIWKQLTSDPANENVSLIPALTTGSTNYKDFKVSYNGTAGAVSAVKYFKWLSSPTEEVQDINIKQDLKNAKDAVKENITNRVNHTKQTSENVKTNVTNIVETQKAKVQAIKNDVSQTKENLQNSKENAKQTSENMKKLFNNAIKNALSKPAPTAATPETPAELPTEE